MSDDLDLYRFVPKPDITTYELALLLRHSGIWQKFDAYEREIPAELRRHFEVISDENYRKWTK